MAPLGLARPNRGAGGVCRERTREGRILFNRAMSHQIVAIEPASSPRRGQLSAAQQRSVWATAGGAWGRRVHRSVLDARPGLEHSRWNALFISSPSPDRLRINHRRAHLNMPGWRD